MSGVTQRFARRADALIVGLATGYRFQALAPFLHSLAGTAYRGSVVLYVGGQSHDCLRRMHDLGVETRQAAPFLSPDTDPQFARYAMYLDCLANWPEPLRFAMLSDIRDVVFQSDPTAQPAITQSRTSCLHTWLESEGIDLLGEPTNRPWLFSTYGVTETFRLAGQPISCSGISMGNHIGTLSYLAAMLEEARVQRASLRFKGVDQGVHNHLLWTRRPVGSVVRRNGDHVLTLGTARRETYVIEADTVRLPDGSVPAVLHQWDRHPELAALIARRFAAAPAQSSAPVAARTPTPPLVLAWVAEGTPQERIGRLIASAAEAACCARLRLIGPGAKVGEELARRCGAELQAQPGTAGFHVDVAAALANEPEDRPVLCLDAAHALLLDDPFRTRLGDRALVTMEGSGSLLGRMPVWYERIAALTDAEAAARIGRQAPVSMRFMLGRVGAVAALVARLCALRAAHPQAHDFARFQVAALGAGEVSAEILPNFSLVANLAGLDDAVVNLSSGPRFPERACAVVLAPERSEKLLGWVRGLKQRFEGTTQ